MGHTLQPRRGTRQLPTFLDNYDGKHLYTIITGANSPSKNAGTEGKNDLLAVTTQALLYGAALPVSAAVTHMAFIHNCHVHRGTMLTPFE